MTIDQLRNYKNWVNTSPTVIRKAAIANGGWAEVFPVEAKTDWLNIGPPTPKVTSVFSQWASRVRNFFNSTPVTLELLPSNEGDRRARQIKNRRGFNIWIPVPFQLHVFALNGNVYADEHGRPWFEMNKVGAVHHYPGKVTPQKVRDAFLSPIAAVFKLVSPDDTGGSMEVVLHNRKFKSTIGKVGQEVMVSPVLVSDEIHRGSYNYSETVVMGGSHHHYRDVKPHSESKGYYVNPPLYSQIEARRFPGIVPYDPNY